MTSKYTFSDIPEGSVVEVELNSGNVVKGQVDLSDKRKGIRVNFDPPADYEGHSYHTLWVPFSHVRSVKKPEPLPPPLEGESPSGPVMAAPAGAARICKRCGAKVDVTELEGRAIVYAMRNHTFRDCPVRPRKGTGRPPSKAKIEVSGGPRAKQEGTGRSDASQAALDRAQLETICAEEGVPVAPLEWDKGLEHGLRCAFKNARHSGNIKPIPSLEEDKDALIRGIEWLLAGKDRRFKLEIANTPSREEIR